MLGDLTLRLGSVGGDVVEDVDQHEEERDEESHPPGDDVRRNHEADPGHHHKQAWAASMFYPSYIIYTISCVCGIHYIFTIPGCYCLCP